MTKAITTVMVVFLLGFAPAAHGAQPKDDDQWPVQCAALYASAYDLPSQLVDAVIQVESGWNRYAVSNKGAAGLMQLMPMTALRFGVQDRFDIEQNIRGGVTYLAWLLRLFDGDLRLALAAYYAGESLVLVHGLRLSSPDIIGYVDRVTRVYRAMRNRATDQEKSGDSIRFSRGG